MQQFTSDIELSIPNQ